MLARTRSRGAPSIIATAAQVPSLQISALVGLCGVDPDTARAYLEKNAWDISEAAGSFYDAGAGGYLLRHKLQDFTLRSALARKGWTCALAGATWRVWRRVEPKGERADWPAQRVACGGAWSARTCAPCRLPSIRRAPRAPAVVDLVILHNI